MPAEENHVVVAIDGQAASGKSSVSKWLARKLGYAHVDTGAMYRALTWRLVELGVDTSEPVAVAGALPGIVLEAGIEDGHMRLRLDGHDPAPHLKDDLVNRNVSAIAAVPEVRELLVASQRGLAKFGPLVMEGRDIGSYVFPETRYKFYIDADPEVRAERRRAEGSEDAISERDRVDSTRKMAPLIVADDARVIDTTHLTLEGVVGELIGRLREKGLDAEL